jgi:hypothetical protein
MINYNDNPWEREYAQNKHLSVWPWSDLVSVFIKEFNSLIDKGRKPDSIRVLELGVGAGANISLFESLGVKYLGLDGSDTIINRLRLRYPNFRFECVDFTDFYEDTVKYDFIIDRASLTHNDTESINRCIVNCYKMLKTNGMFIGVDWFSVDHESFKHGISVDEFTKISEKDGYFAGLGKVHFSTKEHIIELFSNFRIKEISSKTVNYFGENLRFSKKVTFQFVAIK